MKKNKISSPSPCLLSTSAFYRLVAQGVIVDGRAGGRLIGRNLYQGGVRVIRQLGADFVLKHMVAGGSFIMNPRASIWEEDRLRELVNGRAPDLTIGASKLTQTLVTEAEPQDRVLWLTVDQLVIAPQVASEHANELAQINETTNPFFGCDLEEVFEPKDLYASAQTY